MTVRTRFAPSPTGFLHIGGVRTALFNWLFARSRGGKFLLRIDDTDAGRNVESALAPILQGFRWLGLDWDEGPEVEGPLGPYFQSQRRELYDTAIAKLLDSGSAYHDFATTEELKQEREAAEKAGHPFRYSRRWRAETAADAEKFTAEGRQGVVRLAMPEEGQVVVDDLIRGPVTFDWVQENDLVIARGDGSPLYHLASVVDDHAMQISHVIRAEEHLSNTPRQIQIAKQLGYELPRYAHVPFVAEPGSKNKLSKRKLDKYLKNRDFAQLNEHGRRIAEKIGLTTEAETFNPVIVDFYEQTGWIADAMLNYLVLLGWSLDDSTEELSREQMIEHFSLDRVTRAPASFDAKKLMAFQERTMQQYPLKQKVARCVEFLQQAGWVETPPDCEVGPYVAQVIEAAGDRLKVFGDILEFNEFFTNDDDLTYDEKAFAKRIVNAEGAAALLAEYRHSLDSLQSFDAEQLDKHLHDFVESKQIAIGQIIHAIRVAVTGKAKGCGMFETMAILGRDRCVRRIKRALDEAADDG